MHLVCMWQSLRKELELEQQVHLMVIHSLKEKKTTLCLLKRLVSSSDHGDGSCLGLV